MQLVKQEHAFKIAGFLATARAAHQVVVEITRIISAWRSEGETINGDASQRARGSLKAEVIISGKDFQALIAGPAARESVQKSAVSCELFLVQKTRAFFQNGSLAVIQKRSERRLLIQLERGFNTG